MTPYALAGGESESRIRGPRLDAGLHPSGRWVFTALLVGGLALHQLWLFWVAPIIGALAAGGVAFGLGSTPSLVPAAEVTLPKLPYAYDALEPYIDAKTMTIHHTKHHQAYIDRFVGVATFVNHSEPVILRKNLDDPLPKDWMVVHNGDA